MSVVFEGTYAGDDVDIEWDVGPDADGLNGVTPTDPLVKAWMTFKTAPSGIADPGSLQKVITTAGVVGIGQIAQDGSPENGNGTASGVFELTKTDTATLGATTKYYWDIQTKTSSGKIKTVEDGTITFKRGYTDATT